MKLRALSSLCCSSLVTLALISCAQKTTPERKPLAEESVPTEMPMSERPAEPAKAPQHFKAPLSEKSFALLYTAHVQGYVEPCGCTADPLGGIARYTALAAQAQRAYDDRLVVLDAGNLLFEKADDNLPADKCQAEARTSLLLSQYKRLGLVATALGPLDDARGAAFRDALLKEHQLPSLGYLPASLQARKKEMIYAPSTLIRRGEVKVGVTAARLDTPEDRDAARLFLQRESAALKKQGANVVVAMIQSNHASTLELLSVPTGVDVAIVGRDPGEVPRAPARSAGGTIVVAAGAQAQHIGVLEFHLSATFEGPLPLDDRESALASRRNLLEKRLLTYRDQLAEMEEGARKEFVKKRAAKSASELRSLEAPISPLEGAHVKVRSIALGREEAEDKAAAAQLKQYDKSIPDLVATCESGIVCEEPKEGQAVYVGVESCYACHRGAVKFWQEQSVTQQAKNKKGEVVERTLSHANAWETLVHDEKTRDRSCVGCHSVGFNEAGGYCKTSEVGFREGVQCESCHGPASRHVESGGLKEEIARGRPGEQTCRGCHHVPHIATTESFVFNDRLKLILGPGHGEEKLKSLLAPQ